MHRATDDAVDLLASEFWNDEGSFARSIDPALLEDLFFPDEIERLQSAQIIRRNTHDGSFALTTWGKMALRRRESALSQDDDLHGDPFFFDS